MHSPIIRPYPKFVLVTDVMHPANHHVREPAPVNIQSEKNVGEPNTNEGLLHLSAQTISHSLKQLQI